MITIGLSAFLKIACSTPRAQRGAIRKRLLPRKEKKGYDFHKRMRLEAQRFLFGERSAADLLAAVDEITKEPERKAALIALRRLIGWRSTHTGTIVRFDPVLYESPNGLFRVPFAPDFGISVNSRLVAVHIWNTKSVDLIAHRVLANLSLFPPLFDLQENPPEDVAAFSLRHLRMYRLGEITIHASAGTLLVERIEATIDEVARDLKLPMPLKPSSR